jgi:phospholipid transport system transporter-binding protein
MNGFELIELGGGGYALQGELTYATASAALKATDRVFKNGATALRFDLGGIVRSDSAGVALLIEWLRGAERSGAALSFARLPENLRAIARVSGVAEFLPLEPGGGDDNPDRRS